MLKKNREDEITNPLEQKGANQPCPRCRNREFEIFAEAEAPLVANRLDRLSQSFSTPVILQPFPPGRLQDSPDGIPSPDNL
jgi:hypothetical protein